MDTKALRQKILDLAIRGKLVPQNPEDEPASVLLERIRAEKEQMVKDGKLKAKDIKKDTVIFRGDDNLHYEKFADGTVKCIEDEIPFEVPEGWSWCRFSTITVNKDAERKPISLAKRQDVKKIYDYYGASGKIDKIDKYIFDEKLLLIGEDGANLTTRSKPIAFLVEGKYWVNNHAHCIDATNKFILDYLCVYINTISLEKYVTGSAQPKMTQANMNSILVPLPPYKEQCQINLQLSNVFGILNHIENWKTDIVELITETKSKILDLAIRGKLVPQDPNDEPASVLLERIRAEKEELIKQGKIKRDKKASIIFRGDDNSYYEKQDNEYVCIDGDIPYCVPNGWEWCTLGICCQKTIKRGKSPKYSTEGNTLVFAQKCNTKHNGIDLSLALKLEKTMLTKYSDEEFMIDEDIVINSTGTGTLGRVGIYKDSDNYNHAQIVPDSHVTVIRTHSLISSEYVYAFLKYNQPLLEKMGEGSTNQKELKPISLINLRIPIPPLEEQKRIVDKVAMLLNCINSIEVNLV